MNWFSSARLATSTSRCRTRSSLSRRLRASGPTPSVTMKMSAPTMPADAKSPASPRAASVVSVCCTSSGERARSRRTSARDAAARRSSPRRSAAPAALRGRWSCRRSRRSAARWRSRRRRRSTNVCSGTSGQRRLTVDDRQQRVERNTRWSRRRTAPDAPGRPRVGVTLRTARVSSSGDQQPEQVDEREHSPGEVGGRVGRSGRPCSACIARGLHAVLAVMARSCAIRVASRILSSSRIRGLSPPQSRPDASYDESARVPVQAAVRELRHPGADRLRRRERRRGCRSRATHRRLEVGRQGAGARRRSRQGRRREAGRFARGRGARPRRPCSARA